ncbi:MAG TPA: hypothetical protein VG406_21335 [Isosphaeraceae bacterium]|jgi:hypothetical protein|nr:hypothetical protein [Isosphaeraceae bacterium]
MKRVTIGQVLGLIGLFAVGLAALRAATVPWYVAIHSLTLVALLVGLLGAIVRPRDRRPAWVGFALFVWASFLVLQVGEIQAAIEPTLLVSEFVDGASRALQRRPASPPGLPPESSPRYSILYGTYRLVKSNGPAAAPPGYDPAFDAYFAALDDFNERSEYATSIGRLLSCLLLGLVGALLGRALGPRGEPAAPVRTGG